MRIGPVIEMDSTHTTLITTFLTIFSILLFIFCYRLLNPRTGKRSLSSRNKPLEAAGAWPVIGHLHLLNGVIQHEILGTMADNYGPAFTVRLGTRPALVVSNWEVAKECFTTCDKALASRPPSLALKIMGYNNALFAFAPYGQYWRELRKIVMLELLSSRQLDLVKHVWDSEIYFWIKDLYENCKGDGGNYQKVVVDMKQWFADLMMNVVVRLVVGKLSFGKIKEGDDEDAKAHKRQLKALREFFKWVDVFMIEDAFPILTWLDPQGYQRKMKNIARDLDLLLQGWLDEHKMKQKAGDNGRKDFMDIMLSVVKDASIPGRDDDTICKATCLNVILGASDTTTITLTWTLSLLLNNSHVLKKAQEELDAQVGKDRYVEESDIKNLVYLQAIIKEVLRLYPAVPLLGPRESIDDTVVAGYHVPAGTRLIVNLWKIHRDPSIWPDPLEFRPERFLTTHKGTDVWGQNFELTPFGSGRRSCPGISFALQVIPLVLARLLHGFKITTPGGAPVDMTESTGLTNIKATPLDVLISPRLAFQ